ncbi:hypothetical protein RUM44_008691 [Polyplax serrata]|uniref:Uncharacterized protein n=1 Tax=Polyplax serrata TaxID=468196 RepID=A0ABR1B995_POLSC
MSTQGNTLSACNGGATGLLKDIQRRLSNSGILPVFRPDTPNTGNESTLVVPSNKPMKLKNMATGAESYDSLHNTSDHESNFLDTERRFPLQSEEKRETDPVQSKGKYRKEKVKREEVRIDHSKSGKICIYKM